MQTVFISDIHLSENSPEILGNFLSFLKKEATKSEALYILGDLFNVWIGDDDNASWIQEIANALKELNNHGVRIYVIQGNRDFLLGEEFLHKCGAILLPDPVLINLYNIPTVLTHGDLLCTEDHRYQRFRKFSRCVWMQKIFLSLPLRCRKYIAEKLRNKSKNYQKKLSLEKMDVSIEAVDSLVKHYQAKQIIHGHTHKPAVYPEAAYTRFVLPAWHPAGGMVVAKPEEMLQLSRF